MCLLRLKNTLLNRIDNGELLPGERLESERDLAEKYGVNRQCDQHLMS